MTALHLESLHIETVNDIYLKRGILKLIEYPTTFDFLMRVCNGCGSTTIEHDDIQKSIGHETTFNSTSDSSQLISLCHNLAKETVDEIISDRILCKRVTLKIKTVNFEILTRSKTLSSYTDTLSVITNAAVALLKHELDQELELPALRLMGKENNLMIQIRSYYRVLSLFSVKMRYSHTINYFEEKVTCTVGTCCHWHSYAFGYNQLVLASTTTRSHLLLVFPICRSWGLMGDSTLDRLTSLSTPVISGITKRVA